MPAEQDNLFEQPGQHTFSTALVLLKDGRKMRRLGWSSPGMWIALGKMPEATMNGTPIVMRPFFAMLGRDGNFAVWFPAICDILADDWVVVE
ncbi:DUF2829 domain-containing protein [Anaeroselena agilis]|uniref:DUF2829 domain-containing protein n=1 Tax=Anaeroselena agilis TaxID=3063788 RepID=A0ABU3NWL6_9FIRM|nr:DUF2829 domain-containing protein [Selenomonadales bacterium 4137-cl]